MNNYGHWMVFEHFNPNENFGFIYMIINNTNSKSYIGKRNFILYNKQISKIKINDTTSWTKYIGSQKELIADIKLLGKENFSFIIIETQNNCTEDIKVQSHNLANKEIEWQLHYNVLKERFSNNEKAFYNRYIHGAGFDSTGKIVKEETILKTKATNAKNPQQPRNKDNSIYKFKNIKTGETFEGNKFDFAKFSNLPITIAYCISKGGQKQSKGWALFDTIFTTRNIIYKVPKISKSINSTIYKFVNIKTNEVFEGLQSDFRKAKGLSPANVSALITGRYKISKDWSLL